MRPEEEEGGRRNGPIVAVAVSAVVLLLGLSCFLVVSLTGAMNGLGSLFASATATPTPVIVVVPNFKGLTLTQAQALAAKDHLTLSITRKADDTIPQDQVMDQNPEPGSYPGGSTTITLTVSGGPNMVTIPNVVGQDSDKACALLANQYHLVCGNQGPEASNLPAGQITRTDPPAGTQVAEHSTVNYWYSLGPTPTPTATSCVGSGTPTPTPTC